MSDTPRETRLQKLRRLKGSRTTGAVGRTEFERLVAESLASIPAEFRNRLDNVAVIVERKPSRTLLRQMGMSPDSTLLGLYEGIPITERGEGYNLTLPDRITLFREPILAMCRSPREVVEEVRRTVIHEVAHYYGITDEELEEMGYS